MNHELFLTKKASQTSYYSFHVKNLILGVEEANSLVHWLKRDQHLWDCGFETGSICFVWSNVGLVPSLPLSDPH